jgi:glutamyl-tRNA synthetase/glutamyl-Q tRNA(Asp) synthetase
MRLPQYPNVCPDLRAAARRFTEAPVTRFAPSPTGYLHLGHVVNAIYVWGVAQALGGRVLLRIEDHDRVRSRPEFDRAVVEDLAWLGFVPDSGRHPLRQSDALDGYHRALALLAQSHHVYACDCSRRAIGSDPYPGTCRGRDLAPGSGRGIRVQVDRRVERFDDLLLGTVEQTPADQCGDILLRDRDGNWTYQFAVTVDDDRQDVTLVIRGSDLVSSTGRQLALARMLGRTRPPVFLHHPLVVNVSGEKLSKSNHDTGVRELRAQGLSPAGVIGRAAAAVGLLDSPRPVDARAVGDLFP